jgi:hypothetical protein
MSRKSRTEARLDEALGKALRHEPRIAAWFLGLTQFANEVALCDFCRWDNPWSRVRPEVADPVMGEPRHLIKECETDVLAVFATGDGRRLALHIENKLLYGSFTPNQPELYQARKSQWKGRKKLGNYTDATTVLIAPRAFFERLKDRAAIFDSFISHEDIAEYVPEFGAAPAG